MRDTLKLIAAIVLINALGFLALTARAAEIGYGVFSVDGGEEFLTTRGFAIQGEFGGSAKPERYHRDRFAVRCAYVQARPDRDGWHKGREVDGNPDYNYCAFVHRWYTAFGMLKHAPELRFYAGTGIGKRNVSICDSVECRSGDYFIGSRWAFAQELGIKWRRVELGYDHLSTGRLAIPNRGENYWRFGMFAHIGKERQR